MQKPIYLLCLLVFTACANSPRQPAEQTSADALVTDSVALTTPNPDAGALPEEVIGERTAGTVSLLDTINGNEIVTLYDNVLLNSATPVKGWSLVSLEVPISEAEAKDLLIRKGHQFTVEGEAKGEVLADVPLEATTTGGNGQKRGMFYAYIRSGSIKNGSVIERALEQYLQEHPGRSLEEMKPFIKRFHLEVSDTHQPFIEYFNYESTTDDPSPGYRTVLVFHNNRLMGLIDSRRVALKGVTIYKLLGAYNGYFFNDVDKRLQLDYVKRFNQFTSSAD